jgi:hypothetical protein
LLFLGALPEPLQIDNVPHARLHRSKTARCDN